MKLLTIELETADLKNTRLFYTQQLDLPIVAESTTAITFQAGWTQLTFRSVKNSVAPYHFAINVPAGTLEVCMHWFGLHYLDTQACGQTIAEFREWRARSAYFFDNNGNLLEFISRYDLPAADSNMTFDDMFGGISEIGIGTRCVTSATRQLTRRFGITSFDKSKPLPDFETLGDDNGLFVVSKLGRNWLFTNIPAELNEYRITFEITPGGPVHTLASDEEGWLPMRNNSVCHCPLAA